MKAERLVLVVATGSLGEVREITETLRDLAG